MKAGIVRIKPEAALLRERKIQLICSAAGLDVKRKLIVLFFMLSRTLSLYHVTRTSCGNGALYFSCITSKAEAGTANTEAAVNTHSASKTSRFKKFFLSYLSLLF